MLRKLEMNNKIKSLFKTIAFVPKTKLEQLMRKHRIPRANVMQMGDSLESDVLITSVGTKQKYMMQIELGRKANSIIYKRTSGSLQTNGIFEYRFNAISEQATRETVLNNSLSEFKTAMQVAISDVINILRINAEKDVLNSRMVEKHLLARYDSGRNMIYWDKKDFFQKFKVAEIPYDKNLLIEMYYDAVQALGVDVNAIIKRK